MIAAIRGKGSYSKSNRLRGFYWANKSLKQRFGFPEYLGEIMYGRARRAPEYLKCSGSSGKRSPQKGKHAPSFKRDRGSGWSLPLPSHPNMPLRLPSSIIRADGRTTKSIGRDESTKRQSGRESGAECGFKFKAQSVNPIRPRHGGGASGEVTQRSTGWSLSGMVV